MSRFETMEMMLDEIVDARGFDDDLARYFSIAMDNGDYEEAVYWYCKAFNR